MPRPKPAHPVFNVTCTICGVKTLSLDGACVFAKATRLGWQFINLIHEFTQTTPAIPLRTTKTIYCAECWKLKLKTGYSDEELKAIPF